MNQSRALTPVLGLLISVGLVIGLVWGIYHFAENDISGEGFSVQWISIRSLVTDGNSPYGDLVTAKIQETIKYENSFGEGTPPRYTSPIYSAIIIIPFALIENYTLAHALWLTAQLMAIFLIILIGLKITNWRPAWYSFLVFMLVTIFSYHIVVPWLDGGLSLWASLFLVLAFLMIRNNWNEVGGIFLALAAIQPQMVLLVIIFVLLWAASQRKRLLAIWFLISLIFSSIIGLFLVPDWIMQYLRILYSYRSNFPPGNPGILFRDLWPGLGRQLGWLVTGLSGVILLAEWWFAMRRDFRWFVWTACLTIVISQWIGLPTIPGNFIGLILPLILISTMLTERWPRGGQWVAVFITIVLFVWEWGLFYLDMTGLQPGMQLNLIIPLPMILLIGLYWVRWWGIKPQRLLIEELRFSETH